MQNTCVKAQIIRNGCDLSLSQSPDAVDVRTVCSLNSPRVKIRIPGL
jgi:hypothetical protein